MKKSLFVLFLFPLFIYAQAQNEFKTKKVIVLIMDGPRYQETWGDSTHQYIPKMANEMASKGIVFTNFYNDGFTYTTSGHTAICTGHRQELENKHGSQLPNYPSIFQYYLQKSSLTSDKAYVITSKDKLNILGNTNMVDYKDKYQPTTLCGINGPGTGYTHDTVTSKRVMEVLKTKHPNLVLVNFKEPDASGHAKDWDGYLKGIRQSDSLIWEVWKYIQQDEYYKDQTAFIVTNDHGRHNDGHKDAYVNHGDDCSGCRHINLYAYGPDFKIGKVEETKYVQVDITATIAYILGLKMPYGEGKVIEKMFK